MMRALWISLRFELTSSKRRFAPYMMAFILMLLPFTMVLASGGFLGSTINFDLAEKVLINSPVGIHFYFSLINICGMLVLIPLFGQALCRDYEAKFDGIVLSTPVHRVGLSLGRFLGAMTVSIFIFAAMILGFWLATLMPGLQSSYFMANHLSSYLVPFFCLVVPNVLIFGSFCFALAAVAKRMSSVQVGGIVFLLIYLFAAGRLDRIEHETLSALLDPFGSNALRILLKHALPQEQNLRLFLLEGPLLLNRVVWLSLSSIWLLLALSFAQRSRRWSKKPKKEVAVPPKELRLTKTSLNFAAKARVKLLLRQTLFEAKAIFKSLPFLCIAFTGVVYLFWSAQYLSPFYGTVIYPVTYVVLELKNDAFTLFMLLTIVFFTGEILHRERQHRITQIVDALPVPAWLSPLSKFLALQLLIASSMLIVLVSCLLIQLQLDYHHFEWGQAFGTLYGIEYIQYFTLSSLIFFVHTLIQDKYLGHVGCALCFLPLYWLPRFGFDHHLYLFGQFPAIEYSDMNGYGPQLPLVRALQVYWSLGSLLLLGLVFVFSTRGVVDKRLGLRLKLAKQRSSKRWTRSMGILCLAFLAQAGYIFYDTNVLNHYQTDDDAVKKNVRYEKLYSQDFKDRLGLQIVGVKAQVDLFPGRSWLKADVAYTLKNKSTAPISELFVNVTGSDHCFTLTMNRAHDLRAHDEALHVFIFHFAEPVEAGQSLVFRYRMDCGDKGFSKASRNLVANGTFFNHRSFFPSFGYDHSREVERDRAKYSLEPIKIPSPSDMKARRSTIIGTDGNWIAFEATVSTDHDQIALAPGHLEKEWEEGGRRFFHYVSEHPILNAYAFISGRYEVRHDTWNDVAIDVYYHKGHEFNVDAMIKASKEGLSYYSKFFGPYPYPQFRIAEIPRYWQFAQSFPNTVAFSEGHGFIARIDRSDHKAVNYNFSVTAHELAHQWWGHQVVGANVPGSQMLSESLAQYASLMVMEKQPYGRDIVEGILKRDMDSYLSRRKYGEEQALAMNQGQHVIAYDKGRIVLYALRSEIGEQEFNAALRQFSDRVRFQGAPFTTSLELVDSLKASVDPKYRDLIDDMLLKIVIYDNKIAAQILKEEQGGSYSLDLEILGRKLYVDHKREEHEAPFEQDMVIRVRDKDKKQLLLKRFSIHAGLNKLKIKLDRRPGEVDLDPTGIWIDKNREDNHLKL